MAKGDRGDRGLTGNKKFMSFLSDMKKAPFYRV